MTTFAFIVFLNVKQTPFPPFIQIFLYQIWDIMDFEWQLGTAKGYFLFIQLLYLLQLDISY